MSKPKGPTLSLLSARNGKPSVVTTQGKRTCYRCKGTIDKDTKCFEIPKVGAFTSKKPYCSTCFSDILTKTKADLGECQAMFDENFQ
jgi:hypothetical protein